MLSTVCKSILDIISDDLSVTYIIDIITLMCVSCTLQYIVPIMYNSFNGAIISCYLNVGPLTCEAWRWWNLDDIADSGREEPRQSFSSLMKSNEGRYTFVAVLSSMIITYVIATASIIIYIAHCSVDCYPTEGKLLFNI